MPKQTTSFVNFKTPAHLIQCYDDELITGRVKQYPWQLRACSEFAKDPPIGEINEGDLVAANDSGKSKMVLAPCALWSVCQFDRGNAIVTSASGKQLDRQSAKYIKDYAIRMNKYHNQDLWTIQNRLLRFSPTKGDMDLFATDEPGKAEGWHAADYGSAFSILVDEAKSVDDTIFQALDRCHDAQRILRVTSPALGTVGYAYKRQTSGSTKWLIRVTAYDCPHIHKSKIRKIIDTYGLHSPITRSIIFAEYTSIDQSVVIQKDWIDYLVNNKPLPNFKDQPLRVGCDMAAGGDENVITVWQGNIQKALRPWRDSDTVRTKDLIATFMLQQGVSKDSEYLFFDDGHVGHSIVDMLQREGWNIQRVINQSSAIRDDMYVNRGAELWFNFASFIHPHKEIILLDDPILRDQLSNRYFVQATKGKIKLESKREAKSGGHPSPDRADATVLAFTGMQAPWFSVLGKGDSESKSAVTKSALQMTSEELTQMMDNYQDHMMGEYEGNRRGALINGCMSQMINAGRDEGKRDWNEIEEQLNLVNLIKK